MGARWAENPGKWRARQFNGEWQLTNYSPTGMLQEWICIFFFFNLGTLSIWLLISNLFSMLGFIVSCLIWQAPYAVALHLKCHVCSSAHLQICCAVQSVKHVHVSLTKQQKLHRQDINTTGVLNTLWFLMCSGRLGFRNRPSAVCSRSSLSSKTERRTTIRRLVLALLGLSDFFESWFQILINL